MGGGGIDTLDRYTLTAKLNSDQLKQGTGPVTPFSNITSEKKMIKKESQKETV